MKVGEARQLVGQAQVLEGGRRERDPAQRGIDSAQLAVQVGAEARLAFEGIREIDLAILFELLALRRAEQRQGHGARPLGR